MRQFQLILIYKRINDGSLINSQILFLEQHSDDVGNERNILIVRRVSVRWEMDEQTVIELVFKGDVMLAAEVDVVAKIPAGVVARLTGETLLLGALKQGSHVDLGQQRGIQG
jgi:hypothetical protein